MLQWDKKTHHLGCERPRGQLQSPQHSFSTPVTIVCALHKSVATGTSPRKNPPVPPINVCAVFFRAADHGGNRNKRNQKNKTPKKKRKQNSAKFGWQWSKLFWGFDFFLHFPGDRRLLATYPAPPDDFTGTSRRRVMIDGKIHLNNEVRLKHLNMLIRIHQTTLWINLLDIADCWVVGKYEYVKLK